ncbi:MAG: RpiB/LacA/LacB family sugar-phosphate isomerase [Candidatus Yonathbacteria bacterium]|nr:RpiB/LacA/LacB family sugar-phosphate isomerase [Candidatus Yonathbacteria bacterium]
MNIHIAADHAGYMLKEHLKSVLKECGHTVVDHGASAYHDDDDYPDFVRPAAEAVGAAALRGEDVRGIVIGGSGQGEAMVANRVPGVRAAVWYGGNKSVIGLSREHNNANILSIGARFVDDKLADEMIAAWLATPFSQDERHVRRIEKMEAKR